MKKVTMITLLMVGGILLLLNLLSRDFFLRFDLTREKQYTLSRASKDVLKNLEDPVTISAYFSKTLPTQLQKLKNDFNDMLLEYSITSGGMLDFEFISPEDDPLKEQEVQQSGIRPLTVNVREKDQLTQQNVYLGAIVRMGEQSEVIPFIQPDQGMEYSLTTSIKKLSVIEKPSVGIIQGHGEPALNELSQVIQSLSILYNVQPIDLPTVDQIPDIYQTIAIIGPKDSMSNADFAKFDQFLSRGGNLLVSFDNVQGDFSTAAGNAMNTGMSEWLGRKGLIVEQSFVLDASCGTVSVQQQQAGFTFNTQVQFPYFPLIKQFPDHAITEGLDQVMLQFASPIRFAGDSTINFTPILTTSEKTGTANVPTYFQVDKKWATNDFPMSNLSVGGVLSGNMGGNVAAKMVVFTDGDFAVSGQRGQSPDNISLLVNGIDWLSDDTGLINLRTKGTVTRPIKDLEDSERSFWKFLNLLLPIILVIAYGLFRARVKKNERMRRMVENYS